jgi:hypothetical protein
MQPGDLGDYVEHFRARVLQDAIAEACAHGWRRRAQAFRDAMPRAADFVGQATHADLAAQAARLEQIARACEHRAQLALGEAES